MIEKPRIVILADSPGPAESLAAVIQLLRQIAEVKILAIKTAYPILEPYGAVRCEDEQEGAAMINSFKPAILIFGISSLVKGPYVLNEIVKKAKKLGIFILMFQDFWANHKWPINLEILKFCDIACVIDEYAKELLRQDFGGKIYITGNPGFDKFFNIDLLKERKRLRSLLGIDDEARVILYAGQGTPQSIQYDKESFLLLCNAIRIAQDRSNDKIILISRPHPRAEEIGYYKDFSEGINVCDTSGVAITDELLPCADLIVSMFATNLIHAAILGIPTVSIIIPQTRQERLRAIHLDDFPLNKRGVSVGVYDDSPDHLSDVIVSLFTDTSLPRSVIENQHNRLGFSSGAAEKFTRIVFDIIQKQHTVL